MEYAGQHLRAGGTHKAVASVHEADHLIPWDRPDQATVVRYAQLVNQFLEIVVQHALSGYLEANRPVRHFLEQRERAD